MTEIINSAEQVAREASKPGKFNLIERLTGRNYPTEVVDIYLDEAAGYEIQKAEEQLARTNGSRGDKIAALEEKIDALKERARESLLRVHIEGIPSERWDELVEKTEEEFPTQYNETRNPLTMAPERTPIPNEDRDTYFRVHSWALFIRRIEDATGAEAEGEITPEITASMFGQLPVAALIRIQNTIDKVRMAVDWMDEIQGEDFLAKS